jgi:hypothetical protein
MMMAELNEMRELVTRARETERRQAERAEAGRKAGRAG